MVNFISTWLENVETVLEPLLVSMLHGEMQIPVYQH